MIFQDAWEPCSVAYCGETAGGIDILLGTGVDFIVLKGLETSRIGVTPVMYLASW